LNKPAFELADFKNESPMAEPTIRREFKDTAFWQADVVTGGDGKATVQFKLPDNLTTWRATARAVTADTRVGSSVQKVLARKDVIMRLEMPRFLTEGDTVTISGVVHNFLNQEKSTRISLDLNGAQLVGEPAQTITIPRNGQYRVDWRVSAPQSGELRLLAKAVTDTESDAVEMTMPIVPHGLKQTMGGAIAITQNDGEQTQTFNLAHHPDVQARSLTIEAAPSVAGTLFGALDYLTSFPYGCTEQTMSSFLPNLVVAQTLKDVPTARIRADNDLSKKVQRGLDRLYSYQHQKDGGWGWWKDDDTDPFMTAYVVDGLTLASRAGFQVEQWRLDRGRDKLAAMLDANKRDDGNPIDSETRAYMIYALVESGSSDAHYLEQLYANHEKLQSYGRALLALAFKQRGDDRAREIASEIEGSAHANEYEVNWQTNRVNDYGQPVVLDVETTALSLKALAQISPRSPLLPKAARWLVDHRRHGYYWLSTKETAFALLGLSDYLKVSQELSPDYTFEIYLNGEQVLSQHVTSAGIQTFTVTKKGGEVGANNQVRIVKHGRGALYVSTALEYFTADDEVQPQSSSDLKLTREYLRLRVAQNAGSKPGWKVEPLTGELRSGDLIVVRLRLEGARAQYLMIEDPIPSGCEQIARADGLSFNYTDKDWTDWYSNREFRDNRTVFFQDYFKGKAHFQYVMRVEVPGEFRVAPARAELMYQPTVQSNTGNGRLRFLDKK
ncbi:MAG TPA: alpha-2-macroglobulin family protein, partial [Pyrinomonadaceae bacterium]|nr:alpha-2-macroglobulin family protein [Pyrinomonadaceae bacterium]